jgi:hypothetical protein
MDAQKAVKWMLSELERQQCLYQDDVVDFLVKSDADNLLRENSEGNLVLERPLLNEFRKLTEKNVVWVVPERYWRFRVPEDEPGRNAKG